MKSINKFVIFLSVLLILNFFIACSNEKDSTTEVIDSTRKTIVYEATASDVFYVINSITDEKNLNKLKVKGQISNETIILLRDALSRKEAENWKVKFDIDLSETTGLTTLKKDSFSCYYKDDECFEVLGLENVISIELPDTVKKIEMQAIYCPNLETIDFGKNLEILGDNDGYYLFDEPISLKKLEIPASTKEIKTGSLLGYENLEKISVEAGNKYFKSVDDKLLLSADGKKLILCARTLSDVVIPSTVTSIEKEAFFECLNIKRITIPSSVKIINENAFKNCSNLEEVNLNEGLETIDRDAFEGTIIKSIKIPASVKKIETISEFIGDSLRKHSVFGSACEKIEVDSGSITYKADPLNVLLMNVDGNKALRFVTVLPEYFAATYVIPNTVIEVERGCFAYCDNLRRVTIPTNVQFVGRYAFMQTVNGKLETVTFDKITQWYEGRIDINNSWKYIDVQYNVRNGSDFKDSYSYDLKQNSYVFGILGGN